MKSFDPWKRWLWIIVLLTVGMGTGSFAKEAQRPNIVFILVDDLRWDALGCTGTSFLQTPNIDRIAEEGALFKNTFTTISLCSPSRAGFLTGTYPQLNGVMRNEGTDPDPSTPNIGHLLQETGYETAFIGKWHMKKGANPRPGFDYWLSFDGQGTYINPPLNENGVDFQKKGYMTDILTGYAVDWLKKPHDKPFLLCLSHKAVHLEKASSFIPAERHEHLYESVRMPEPPTWKNTLAGKPEWQRAAWVWGNRHGDWVKNKHLPVPETLPPPKWNEKLGGMLLHYFQTLSAVDDGVGKVFQTLEELGELDNTVIIFSSDNGFHHPSRSRIRSDKRTAHEDSIRLPFLLRYPPLVKPGTTVDEMVLNIDLLPSLLDLADADCPAHVQGQSFLPLLEDRDVEWRKSFLYQYHMEGYVPGIPGVYCVRTENWKYMMYPDIKNQTRPDLYDTLEDMDELYNLEKDPYELNNLAENPEYKPRLEQMKKELDRLLESVDSR